MDINNYQRIAQLFLKNIKSLPSGHYIKKYLQKNLKSKDIGK